jgi:Protein of unknown function (DUF4245)
MSDAGSVRETGTPTAPRRRPRGFETVGDMIRSIGVVLAAVTVILLITLRAHPAAIKVVDAAQARQAAQAVAKFHAEEPSGLSGQWRLTSARFEPADVSPTGADLWHLGWVTPANRFAALEQSDGSVEQLVRSVVGNAQQTGSGAGSFAGWQRWTGDPSNWTVYVRQLGSSTLVIYGSASDAELAQLVAALQPSVAP